MQTRGSLPLRLTTVILPLILCLISLTHAAQAEVKGKQLLENARVSVATQSGEWTNEIPLDKASAIPVKAQWKFRCPEPKAFISLTLIKPYDMRNWKLNGSPVPPPMKDMSYSEMPGIPANLLKQGENVLEVEWSAQVRGNVETLKADSLPIRLYGLAARDMDIQSGPVIGAAGTDYFTVSFRTNAPAAITVSAAGKQVSSPAGIVHTVKITGLKPATAYSYTVTAKAAATVKKLGPYAVSTLPTAAPFKFVAFGDSRSRPEAWTKVANAVLQQKPAFVVNSGDLVASGRDYNQWDTDYFSVTKDFFAAMPMFAVQGNHDEDSPMFHQFFDVEPGKQNWFRAVGPVLFIGINAKTGWAAGSENIKWLENVLSASKEKYIILASHYAAWSSGPGGDARQGIILDREVEEAQKNILPLLAKYKATAMVAGHSHFYERSEPPDNVSIIITGGAGAPIYDKRPNAEEINPHSKVFAREHHYCLFTVEDHRLQMQVLNVDGKELDSREWKPRTILTTTTK